MAALVVTSLLLVPGQGTVLAGVEVLAVGVADWAAIVAIQPLRLRNWRLLEPALRWPLVTRVVLGWGVGGLYPLVAPSFLVAAGDAWIPTRRDPPPRRRPGLPGLLLAEPRGRKVLRVPLGPLGLASCRV